MLIHARGTRKDLWANTRMFQMPRAPLSLLVSTNVWFSRCGPPRTMSQSLFEPSHTYGPCPGHWADSVGGAEVRSVIGGIVQGFPRLPKGKAQSSEMPKIAKRLPNIPSISPPILCIAVRISTLMSFRSYIDDSRIQDALTYTFVISSHRGSTDCSRVVFLRLPINQTAYLFQGQKIDPVPHLGELSSSRRVTQSQNSQRHQRSNFGIRQWSKSNRTFNRRGDERILPMGRGDDVKPVGAQSSRAAGICMLNPGSH